jgi:hypothetical protein
MLGAPPEAPVAGTTRTECLVFEMSRPNQNESLANVVSHVAADKQAHACQVCGMDETCLASKADCETQLSKD